jgi:hypothetical protein
VYLALEIRIRRFKNPRSLAECGTQDFGSGSLAPDPSADSELRVIPYENHKRNNLYRKFDENLLKTAPLRSLFENTIFRFLNVFCVPLQFWFQKD